MEVPQDTSKVGTRGAFDELNQLRLGRAGGLPGGGERCGGMAGGLGSRTEEAPQGSVPKSRPPALVPAPAEGGGDG